MKVPSLVSKAHGCIDSIEEGVTGEYIDISATGVNEGLTRIISEGKIPEYGRNARERVLKHYDHQVMWPEILEYYNLLLKHETSGG